MCLGFGLGQGRTQIKVQLATRPDEVLYNELQWYMKTGVTHALRIVALDVWDPSRHPLLAFPGLCYRQLVCAQSVM